MTILAVHLRVESAALLVVLMVAGAVAGAQPEKAKEAVLKMPADRDLYFRNYCLTGSYYVHFLRGGAYRRITREHTFVGVTDRGTWKQADTGEIILVSGKHKYASDPETSPFFITPITYKDVTTLLWKGAETSTNRDLAEIKGTIDRRKRDERIAYIYVEIDRATFERETASTQEFLFHPEMNRRVRQK